jgi:hypothetical protein
MHKDNIVFRVVYFGNCVGPKMCGYENSMLSFYHRVYDVCVYII